MEKKVLKFKTDREIDALIAQKVFEQEVFWDDIIVNSGVTNFKPDFWVRIESGQVKLLPYYSLDAERCIHEIVPKMKEHGYILDADNKGEKGETWLATFMIEKEAEHKNDYGSAHDEIFSRAVCKAALAVFGIKIE